MKNDEKENKQLVPSMHLVSDARQEI